MGDEVALKRESDLSGVVIAIDHLYDHGGTTTCQVVWGVDTLSEAMEAPPSARDIQWTNKLVAADTATDTLLPFRG